MTLADRIVEVLHTIPAELDDDELADRLGVVRQAVNQACRKLAAGDRLRRGVGTSGKIINTLDRTWRPVERLPAMPAEGSLLIEDEIKGAVRHHLASDGYDVRVAWGRQRGIDIEATRSEPPDRLVIEAKGEATLQPQQVNYFLGALGELIQRMDDPSALVRTRAARQPPISWTRPAPSRTRVEATQPVRVLRPAASGWLRRRRDLGRQHRVTCNGSKFGSGAGQSAPLRSVRGTRRA